MKSTQKCESHAEFLQFICPDCKKKMCCNCLNSHLEKCSHMPLDFKTFASEFLLPEFQKRSEIINKEDIEKTVLFNLKINLVELKEKTEKLIENITNALNSIENKPANFSESMGKVYKHQISTLQSAISSGNIRVLLECIDAYTDSEMSFENESKKSSISNVNYTVKKILKSADFALLNNRLKSADRLFKQVRNLIPSSLPVVTNKFIYGINNQKNCFKILIRYNIYTKKISDCISLIHGRSVLQIDNQIFITGGYNPLSGATDEYKENTKSLISKARMRFPKFCHKMIAIANSLFWSIGGFTGIDCLSCCEEYSIANDRWVLLPSLKRARRDTGAVLLRQYVYAIGGYEMNNTIERLDILERNEWENVSINAREISISKCPGAFPISTTEIMILEGDDRTNAAIYNVQEGKIIKFTSNVLSDLYQCNSVSYVKGCAYLIGSHYGHIFCFNVNAKRFEVIDYATANQ